jgi:endonuclease/exonuclease/phosphatase (EEP) superfamily protein YafD
MRWQPILCWALAGICALWVVVRYFGLERGFPAVPLIAFTPLMAFVAAGTTITALALREWPAAALALAATVALILIVVPRARGHADPDAPGATLRVLAINAKLGEADARAIVDAVRDRDVDLLSVEELTPGFAAELDADGLHDLLPAEALSPRPGADGTGLYARFPLAGQGAGTRERSQQSAAAQPPGAVPLQIVSVHPQSPIGLPAVGAWGNALDDLPPAEDSGPVRLLLGDFNASLDHDKLRDLISTGYTDAGDVTGRGLRGTFPPWLPLIALDHVLVDDRAAVRDYDVLKIPGSDHRAVYAELALPYASASSASRPGAGSRPLAAPAAG